MYVAICIYMYIIIIIIIIKRRSEITSHTSHGHMTGTMGMQTVRSEPLGGPVALLVHSTGLHSTATGLHSSGLRSRL